MTFNFKKSEIYKAIVFYRIFPASMLKLYRVLLLILGLAPIVIFVSDSFLKTQINLSIGWSFIILPVAGSVMFFELFGGFYLRYPKINITNSVHGRDETGNVAELMEFEAAKIFDNAFELARSLGEKELTLKILLAAILDDHAMEKLFTRIIPAFKSLKKQLKQVLSVPRPFSVKFSLFTSQEISPEVLAVLEDASVLKDEHGGMRISSLDIMASLFDHSDEFKQFIISQDLDKGDLNELAKWYEHIWDFWRERRKFWSPENLMRQLPVGRDWVYGYSPHLAGFAINLTDKMTFAFPTLRLMSRQKEIDQIEQILSRSGEENVLLVGEEGVGKDRIITDFAELIAKGKALPQLNYKKIFDLNLSLVTGASKDITDIQNILLSIFNEATRSGNVILVIKNFHNFIGEIDGMGRLDISEIVLPYLKSSSIQVIATTDPASFHKFIENRSDMASAFERINIYEPSLTQTLEIIEEAVPAMESHAGVLITYGAIKSIVEGADKYIRTAPFPEKAFDLMSEVVSFVSSQKRHLVETQDVNEVIHRKTGIPLGPIAGEEKDRLVKLEELMHKELVGQERAVEVVSGTMRRLRTGLAKRGKPAGVFLFVGPTGVGKTLTAKILAKTYFGSVDRMLRFDMSEYQNPESLDHFIGSTRTNEQGQFVTLARDNPFSLILLDEIEKADKNILNIFLQVFDEGHLTDAFGRKINFEQNIIIATSNAGAEYIREMVKEGLDPSLEKEKIVDVLVKGGFFRPELLNRFDEIVIFHPLTQDQVGSITGMLLESLASRMKEQGYIYKPTDEISQYVAKASFDPQFGARPMERVIRDKIENTIARKILDGSIQKGKEFSLVPEDLK